MHDADARPDPFPVPIASAALDAEVRVPGSKSITNRALVCAALAHGTTSLDGVLVADDTEAMMSGLRELGVGLTLDRAAARVEVVGTRSGRDLGGGLVDARLSGTTSRFLLPVAALADATSVVDGEAPLRRRPMGDLLDALAQLGAEVEPLGQPGHLPVRVEGSGLAGGAVAVRGDVSSQFLSALLLAAPSMDRGLDVEVTTELVSLPYVEMTLEVMAAFGARVQRTGRERIEVEPGGYRAPERYEVEPDASAASYAFAAAAIVGGRVRVEGLGATSLQGDLAFLDALESMGATVERTPRWVEVRGGAELRGVEVDLRDCSDTAQTLAVVAPFATSSDDDHRDRLHPRQGDRSDRCGGRRAASLRHRRRGAPRRPPRPPRCAPRCHGADLRRPPHGDELRPARTPHAGPVDRRSRVRGQDLPRLLGAVG